MTRYNLTDTNGVADWLDASDLSGIGIITQVNSLAEARPS